jgi:hypothetical protein
MAPTTAKPMTTSTKSQAKDRLLFVIVSSFDKLVVRPIPRPQSDPLTIFCQLFVAHLQGLWPVFCAQAK